MIKVLLVLLTLLSVTVVSDAQRKHLCKGRASGFIKSKQPVYITFERAGKREPLRTGESNEGIWLRLHNKSNKAIILDMSGVPSEEYGDTSLYYDVLSGKDVVIKNSCHVCSVNKVISGESLVFSLPREYLAAGHTLRISFSYAREGEDDVFADGKPKQYVYFQSTKLPQRVRRKG